MSIIERNPLISVVIRCKNEERYLPHILEAIKNQTYKNIEIIIVDDHSQDKTLTIAKQYGCKIIHFPDNQRFSHGLSCNLGAVQAKGEYISYLNGHTIPDTKMYLENGLKEFENVVVWWVYGPLLAHKDGTLADKLLFNIYGYVKCLRKHKATRQSINLLATMNAMIRRDLREQSQFDEDINWGLGGEDYKWAAEILTKGYVIIHNNRFRVRHSHHLKMSELLRQFKNRKKMAGDSTHVPEAQKRHI